MNTQQNYQPYFTFYPGAASVQLLAGLIKAVVAIYPFKYFAKLAE